MKVLVVVGTRPEAIKMAPVVQALRARSGEFQTAVCLSGQHRELLDQVIRVFNLPVDYDLEVMTPGQSVHAITSRVLTGMRDVLETGRPDVMLVHGDTTTSFAAALAGYYAHVPVGHVEAGLRTYDKYRPFPEEMNRRLADALCDYHYAPTPAARDNLLCEHIPAEHILVTGNTVIDALLYISQRTYSFSDPLLAAAGTERRLLLVTAHRRESFGEPFRDMCRAIADLAAQNPDLEIIYPVHPNPQVRKVTGEILDGCERIHLIEPLDYLPFVHLLKKAHIVLTDSGGIQEEAPSLGKPVLVMRDVTERPEAIAAGTAQLTGTRYDSIVSGVQRLLDSPEAYAAMANRVNPYGDGHAAPRIVEHLAALSKQEDRL
jgi:UDP-N-acetylglucosamine 2-epimerase (non-hydrolysing)